MTASGRFPNRIEAARLQQDATITACDTEPIDTAEHETAEAHAPMRGKAMAEADRNRP